MNLKFNEFVPPIFGRILKKISKKKSAYIYPFNMTNIDRDIKTVFDIGANVGDVSIAALKTFPKACIYAFEPVKDTYQYLCKNIELYDKRVIKNNFGFYNVKKNMDINITSFHGANSILSQSKTHNTLNPHVFELQKERIELITIDEYVKEQGIKKIDVVKIDVEGVEKEVIEGGNTTFKNKVENIFIEISFVRRDNDFKYPIEIFKLLSDLDFSLINIYDFVTYNNNGRQQICQFDAFFTKIK
jgi:FkbM family methyltransferase